jgi:uncharacterized membrane protein
MTNAGLAAHIFFGTLGFGVVIAFDLLLIAIARSRRLDVIQATYRTARRYLPLIGLSFLLAILLGFGIAAARHESFISRWLLITYAWLIVAGAANGIAIQRRTQRVLAEIETSHGAMTPDLERMLSRAWPIGATVSAIAMFAILAVMIAKPS